MSILKRITQILTPPIRRKSKLKDTSLSSVRESGGATRIGDILKHLLTEEKKDAESIRDALSELRDIASEYGSYMTATEIRDCVLRMPDKDEEGRAYRKGRGYELAADLYQQSLSKKIIAVDEGILAIEPEEFSGYCKELLECLFLARKYRRGIQVCLEICEDLVFRGCDPSEAARLYRSWAKESVTGVLELTLQEKEQADRIYNRAKREHRKIDTPMPEDSSSSAALDEGLLIHLDELRQKVLQIAMALSRADVKPEIAYRDLKGTKENDVLQKHLAYTELLRRISSSAQYLPLEAFAYEQAAVIKESMARGSGLDHFKAAAQLFVKQAEIERNLSLAVLSRRHYERAAELWRLAGDMPLAENARTMASNLARE